MLATAAAIVVVMGLLKSGRSHGQSINANAQPDAAAHSGTSTTAPTLELSASQFNAIKIAPVGTHAFPVEIDAVGSIDFDEDLSVQVFSPYQGKIINTLVDLGDEVQKGQPLYSIDSPDLVQAESTLIGAAADYELTTKELARAKALFTSDASVPQRELEQATSDQQTAEGALKAARDAVRVFGKSEAEIDGIVASRKIDPALIVPSPIAGQITLRDAQPGLLVQPGNPPAPYTVADVSIKWMLANVPESDSSYFHLGQPVEVKVMAYPNRIFKGKVSKIYASIDPKRSQIHKMSCVRQCSPISQLRSSARYYPPLFPPMASSAKPTER